MTSGRLEICFNKAWGTVCNYDWGAPDTRVSCHELGYQADGKHLFHKFLPINFFIKITRSELALLAHSFITLLNTVYRIRLIKRRGYYLFYRVIWCRDYSRAATISVNTTAWIPLKSRIPNPSQMYIVRR